MNRRTMLKGAGIAAGMSMGAFAAPARAQSRTLRVASVTGPAHHHNVALRWFSEQVAARNVGLDLRVLDGGQLGGERDYIEGMMLGSIQMAQVSTAPVAGFIPEFDLFSLPYLIRDTNHFKAVVSGPVGARFNTLAEARGLKILAWFDNGYRNVFNRVRPVVTPQDMNGLKIRVIESRLMVSTINAMGGSATPMAYNELYTALEQGVVDGGENSVGNVLSDRFFEVTRYLSLTQHFRPPGIVAISLRAWRGLSAQQQQVLTQEGARLQDYEIALTTEVSAKALEDLRGRGMRINEVNVEAFRARMGPIYEEFVARHGADLLRAVQNTGT